MFTLKSIIQFHNEAQVMMMKYEKIKKVNQACKLETFTTALCMLHGIIYSLTKGKGKGKKEKNARNSKHR